MFNIDQYLDLNRFKLAPPDKSLFPPDLDMLKSKRCPICLRKLYRTKDGSKWFCKSKAKDRFFIRDEVLKKFL